MIENLATYWNNDENKKAEPIQPIQLKVIPLESNTFRKDLNWPHFDSELKVKERAQVKDDQQF